MSKISPCMGCESRQIGCHANCAKYADFVSKMKAAKQDIWEKHGQFLDYQSRKKNVLKKRKGE